MLIYLKIPKTVQWLLKLFFMFLVIFTCFRLATCILFKPSTLSYSKCFPAFLLGLSYDLRWIAVSLIPISIGSLYFKWTPFFSIATQKFWIVYLAIISFVLLVLFGADFGQFSYVNSRLNADALNFYEDPKESFEMLWQSYPLVWILIALGFVIYFMIIGFKKIKGNVEDKNKDIHKFFYRRTWHIIFLVFLLLCIRGIFTFNTLRWDRAFTLKQEFISNLALNPMQNFFTTLRLRKPVFETTAKAYENEMKAFLKVNQPLSGNPYARYVYPKSGLMETKPNVVLVLCESFSMYKSSMSGNPLNTTPYFNKISKEGIFFDRCFSPHFGTARGVFALLTGIPDVQLGKFSSRNEISLNQYSVLNSLKDYEKYYFLGGRSEFNNFKGMVSNIDSIKIYDQASLNSQKANVWGVSDKDLFMEATSVLSKETKPFFAIVQTADNHRPFDIIDKDTEFKKNNVEKDSLIKYGFADEAEYNTFRYMDFSIEKFMTEMQKLPIYNNTIFVFLGDHGVEGNSDAMYPKAWSEQRLNDDHIPLLFYAPKLLAPQYNNKIVSQIDVLPTTLSLMGAPYLNTTMGRNVMETSEKESVAFIIYHAAFWTGIVKDDYFYRNHLQTKNEELVSIINNDKISNKPFGDSIKIEMKNLTNGIYQTSLWMLVNNKKENGNKLLKDL